MSEIRVTAATARKDKEAFTTQVRNHVSKVANLCGWDHEDRECLLSSVMGSPPVDAQWTQLQHHANLHGSLPIWEWNKRVRAATDQLIEEFYLES